MNTSSQKFENVDEYIKISDVSAQDILQKIRSVIKKSCPEAVECIAYGMPAYKLGGKPLVYFAAFPKHIGFYATPETHESFAKELAGYKQGKGSVQFPLDKPIPYSLIEAMTKAKVKQLISK